MTCTNCNGDGRIVAFEGIRTETRCEACVSSSVVTLEDVIAHHESWVTYFAETKQNHAAAKEHADMASALHGVAKFIAELKETAAVKA